MCAGAKGETDEETQGDVGVVRWVDGMVEELIIGHNVTFKSKGDFGKLFLIS